jgi:NADPH:quinone reductase-like Zn-dependent oxidoreductase
MKCMQIHSVIDMSRNDTPLIVAEIPDPVPGKGEVLIQKFSVWSLPYGD